MVLDIDDGLTEVHLAGQPVRLDLIEIARKMNAFIEQTAGGKPFAYLDHFIPYMREAWKVELREGQADRLWEEIRLQVERQKKDYLDALISLSSTGSTPAQRPAEEMPPAAWEASMPLDSGPTSHG